VRSPSLVLLAAALGILAPVAGRPAAPDPSVARGESAAREQPIAQALERRGTWVRAQGAFTTARWSGSIPDIRRTLAALERADSAYAAALVALDDEPGPMDGAHLERRDAQPRQEALSALAFDLGTRRHWRAARSLLDGSLRGVGELQPLRAWARSIASGPAAGLEVLEWPPDRRSGEEARAWRIDGRSRAGEGDPYMLWTAAILADSAGLGRPARAALWRLRDSAGSPALRKAARMGLARHLFAAGEPRLAASILESEPGRAPEESALLAQMLASGGDTLAAMGWLLDAVERGGSAAERYAAALPAARAALAGRFDSLQENQFMLLATALGNLGEAELALRLLERRGAPADSSRARDRDELRASLLLKARRYSDAAHAYRALLGRAAADERGGDALNLARALRGAKEFEAMDSAFVLAASVGRAATLENAAWERAREWEDRKTAAEAAPVFAWAATHLGAGPLAAAARVHGALAWFRAGHSDSARACLAGAWTTDGGAAFWRAWLERAAGDSAAAREAYLRAAQLQPLTYEGIRARQELGLPPLLTVSGGATRTTRALGRTAEPPPQRVALADLLGLGDAAVEMLRDCASTGDAAEAAGCIDALEARGLYRAGRRTPDTELRLTRPPAFPRAVLDAADSERVDPYLLWSLMLQESAFDAAARSRAGAIGLLQLMPATASKLAGHGVTADSLVNPERNVRLAARYVAGLLKEFHEPRAVMAAYNAGEDAVRRWVAARPAVDDLWVELIPYKETREYVKSVYTTWRQYAAVYGANPGD
jgi:soluble lytic murein transglycosylase